MDGIGVGTRHRWTRRATLRAAAAAGAALAAGAVLDACGTAANTGAAPTKGSGKIVLKWRPWYGATPQTLPLMYQGTQPFRDKNPGIDVRPVLDAQLGGMAPEMIAGDGPDVFQDWVLPPYVANGLALDLEPYISKDNVDIGTFSSSEMDFFREVSSFAPGGKGLYFLPCYIHTQTIVVNLSVLDQLGFSYPNDTGMTWSDWAQSFRKWTAVGSDPSKSRMGGAADWEGYNDSSYNFISPYYLAGSGGGYVDPADPTKSILGTPATVNFAAEYVQLVRDKVLGFPSFNDFATGRAVSSIRGSGSGLVQAATQWRGFKWRFFPPPIFPNKRTAYSATDAYGIWAGTKHVEAAWSFFKWLTVEPTYAQFMIKLQLRGPAQLNLWDNWVTEVSAAAPPLAATNLQALAQGPVNDWTYPGYLFRYNDSGVRTVLNNMSTQVMSGKVDVALALPQAAAQIEAIQKIGAASNANPAALIQGIKSTTVGANTNYPSPARAGQGAPYSKNPYILSDAKTGAYTLLGDGWDVWLSSDNGSFAAVAATETEGYWQCRITGISNLTCPHLSQWSKFGIMARGDLSDDAPMCTLHVDGGHSIEWQYRGIAGITPGGQSGLSLPPPGSKSGNTPVMQPNTKSFSNYLIRPVWLRLQRKGTSWTPWASWDGTTWVQTGSPQLVPEMGGCWVGIIACAHNGSFNDTGYARATFDNLSFKPTDLVQLGDQGVPPAAGPVPKAWATMAGK